MPFAGTIRVPSDKSISHRAVLFAGLAQGVSHLEALLPSADVQATIRAIRALGARVDLVAGPHGLVGEVEGIGLAASKSTRPLVIDCGNSGTTATKAAEDGSAGTVISCACMSTDPSMEAVRPSTSTSTPKAGKSNSV